MKYVILTALALAQPQPMASWTRLAPRDCPRSALFPDGAASSGGQHHTRVGTLDYRTVAADFGTMALSLTVVDLPPGLDVAVFAQARSELAGHYQGKVLGFAACAPARDGCQAVRFTVQDGVGLSGKAWIFVDDEQLVVANAIGPADDEESDLVAERFFTSVEPTAERSAER